MRLRAAALAVAAVIAAFSVSCTTVGTRLTTPSGFAEFQAAGEYRIISPEGVVLRVRTAENEPVQTLDFWAATLKRQLSQSGYALLAEGTFDPTKLPTPSTSPHGDYFEWSAPVGAEDYTYLTAIALAVDRIVIVEAAGPIEYYKLHAEQIHKALDTLTIAGP